jgi:hypothetical protein
MGTLNRALYAMMTVLGIGLTKYHSGHDHQSTKIDVKNRQSAGKYIFGGANDRNEQAIFIPYSGHRRKLKGYQKQGIRSFNSTK